MGAFDGAINAIQNRIGILSAGSPFGGSPLANNAAPIFSGLQGKSPFSGTALSGQGPNFTGFTGGSSPFGNPFGAGSGSPFNNPLGGGGSPFGNVGFGTIANPYQGTANDPFGTGKGRPIVQPTSGTTTYSNGDSYGPSTLDGVGAQRWLQGQRADSPLIGITPEIVAYARSRGVDPGMLFGVLKAESQFAADGAMGTRQNNPGNIMAPGADPANGRIILRSYGSMLEGVKAMVDLFAGYGATYGAKTVEDMIATYYVGPEAYKKYGLDANDAGGRGPGGNGTVRDYLAGKVYPTMQAFGAQATSAKGTVTKGIQATWGGIGNPTITQEFGKTDFSEGNPIYDYGAQFGTEGHTGLDVGLPDGSRLFAPVGGTIVIAGGSGFYKDESGTRNPATSGEIRIKLDNGDEVILGHTASISVRVGQRVRPGDFLGASGTANGPHLHLEYRRYTPGKTGSGYTIVDPRTVLR